MVNEQLHVDCPICDGTYGTEDKPEIDEGFEIVKKTPKHTHTKPKFPPKTPRFPTTSKWKTVAVAKASEELDNLVQILQKTADRRLPGPIFHAGQVGKTLWAPFSSSLPDELKKMMGGCSTCRHFVETYGDLCVVDDDGSLVPVIWPHVSDLEHVPERYRDAVTAVLNRVSGCVAGDEFILETDKDRVLGQARGRNPKWRHLHVVLEDGPLTGGLRDGLNTTTSSAMLRRVLEDYDRKTIIHAQHLIYEKLPHALGHRPVIDFLEGVLSKVEKMEDSVKKANTIIKYSRIAWPGCLSSLRGGVVGQLLADVAAGNDWEYVLARWTSMANPMVYLRPTSSPSGGNVSEAEKIFKNLGYTKEDLTRHFMTTNQAPESAILWSNPTIWNVQLPATPKTTGIFDSVKTKNDRTPPKEVDLKPSNSDLTEISFRSFARRVVPNAKSIDIYLDPEVRLAFFTAGAPGAKSPFSFGSSTNTASWYNWSKFLPAEKGKVKKGWNPVSSIISFPHMWEHVSATKAISPSEVEWPFSRHGIRYLFCIKGAKQDQRMAASLFPTIMRGEFHCVRKTVEAFSNEERIREPLEEGWDQVGGLAGGNSRWSEIIVRVKTDGESACTYKITLFE
ncbi:hypothetical protein EST38_g1035 [Candolleomyces aberdarensis]|uniref:Uncharacterized protein n=1 Tax=Candolleomyces aberdarensis TaxID=2316362 RepID=A0A4Q2DVZ3_9AGAR|nr:hypothetical protein EST38_g1035 [Candolleomyces aberdarensis]